MRIKAAAALAAAGWSLGMPADATDGYFQEGYGLIAGNTITMSQNAFGIAYARKL